jgi:hypothetical protein
VRAYGADVTAGGGFGTSCSDNNAFIKTYTRPIGELATKSGSGVQLAAMALGEIRGFLSATLRDDLNPPTQPRDSRTNLDKHHHFRASIEIWKIRISETFRLLRILIMGNQLWQIACLKLQVQ